MDGSLHGLLAVRLLKEDPKLIVMAPSKSDLVDVSDELSQRLQIDLRLLYAFVQLLRHSLIVLLHLAPIEEVKPVIHYCLLEQNCTVPDTLQLLLLGHLVHGIEKPNLVATCRNSD